MLIKTKTDEFENYLTDASNLPGGSANKLFVPETAEEIADILKEANENKIPVTVSGARTGTVGGAIPFGGYLVSLEKLNKIIGIDREKLTATVESGVILNDFQKACEAENLFYPPDPTEWSCQIGGTVATNASGARSFKYGATRNFVERIKVVLPSGEIVDIKRGEIFSGGDSIQIGAVRAKLPTYSPPNVRKNTSGYFTGEKIDVVDLFIGSEGTLGVITEIELKILPKPESFLSGIVFFKDEKDLLNFVNEARDLSFSARKEKFQDSKFKVQNQIDASLIEYFDDEALNFIKEKFSDVPENMAGAVFFEQETTDATEDEIFGQWNELLEKHHAEVDVSWFTTTERDREKMREFRHSLPVKVNEWIVRHKQKKVSTDIAVPDENFASMLRFYKNSLQKSGLNYVIFGHIGDNHLHVNILPKDADEAVKARHLYGRFIAQGVMLGGTISAEHGIGKLKSKYLYVQYGERFLNEMAELKKAFDPRGILGRSNIFDAKFID